MVLMGKRLGGNVYQLEGNMVVGGAVGDGGTNNSVSDSVGDTS